MVRTYGNAPYRVAVLHGGPGAPGSCAGLAQTLGRIYGVLEPMQSKYNIRELTEELWQQLIEYGEPPMVLIGHSWGAFFAGIFACCYPELAAKVIFVGCPPLEDSYVAEIGERRKKNLSPQEQMEFDILAASLEEEKEENTEQLARLCALVEQADYYAREQIPEPSLELPADGKMHTKIWNEAVRLRSEKKLLRCFLKLSCDLVLIQGKRDPHPYEGVLEPFRREERELRSYLLSQCGHTPWEEKYAAEEFYQILDAELKQ